MTPEERDSKREAMKARWRDPAYRERMRLFSKTNRERVFLRPEGIQLSEKRLARWRKLVDSGVSPNEATGIILTTTVIGLPKGPVDFTKYQIVQWRRLITSGGMTAEAAECKIRDECRRRPLDFSDKEVTRWRRMIAAGTTASVAIEFIRNQRRGIVPPNRRTRRNLVRPAGLTDEEYEVYLEQLREGLTEFQALAAVRGLRDCGRFITKPRTSSP